MTEKSPEELANEMLSDYARKQGKSLRKLGIIDRHRARRINDREIPMSLVWPNVIPAKARRDDVEDE